MRTVPLIFALALCGCGVETATRVPPLDRLYFPTGLVHVAGATPAEAGTLYVASSDFDKRYDYGALSAIALDELDWPAVACGSGTASPVDLQRPWYLVPGGTPPAQGGSLCAATAVPGLQMTEERRVLTAPFAGMIDVHPLADGRRRIFVPSRAEGDRLFVVDADGVTLNCLGGQGAKDCTHPDLRESQPSLTEAAIAAGEDGADGFVNGKPRAPEPYAATVANGRVLVTHVEQADSPVGSQTNRESFLVNLDANDPVVTADSFTPIGTASSTSVAVGSRYTYVSGRSVATGLIAPAIRLVERRADGGLTVLATELQSQYNVSDTRGLVVYRPGMGEETRIFVLGRAPDVLLVVSVTNAQSDTPSVRLLQQVPLPEGPNDLKLIERSGRPPLLAITCTSAGSVAVYDDETQQLATLVDGVGTQPFALAVHQVPGARGARLYVTNFGDGRVAVVDIPNLETPSEAAVVAHLGGPQQCITEPLSGSACEGAAQ